MFHYYVYRPLRSEGRMDPSEAAPPISPLSSSQEGFTACPPFILCLMVLSLASLWSCAAGQRLPDTPLASRPTEFEEAQDPGPVHLELVHSHYDLRADGTYTHTRRQRYRILDSRGVERWGHVVAGWSPWYMNRPTVKATVKSPDGSTFELDPETLAEQPAYPDAPDIYEDRRVLKAPLPNVKVGSIIEETIVTTTHRPFFEGGLTRSLVYQNTLARDTVELVVEAPQNMPLNFVQKDVKVSRSDETVSGRKRVTFAGGPFAALDSSESHLPKESRHWPHVSFSSGTSWQQVARAYSKTVEEKLKGIDFKSTVSQVVGKKDSQRQVVSKLHKWLKDRVRYAAIEFGESSIVPHTPITTMSNGYGDCKDQATLLVGLLRAAGVDAAVALLQAGTGPDVKVETPTLDVFNHAIVVAKLDQLIWIDPTADLMPVSNLPYMDQDRLALIVDSSTKKLTPTPKPTSATNSYRERRLVRLGDHGAATVKETTSAKGWHDWNLRSQFAFPKGKALENLKRYVDQVYSATDVENVSYGSPQDISKPFKVKLEAKKAQIGWTDFFVANTSTGPGPILKWLPAPLTQTDGEERKNDLVLTVPYQATLTWEVHPPEGFVSTAVPNSTTFQFGPATLNRSTRRLENGAVEVRQSFDSVKRQLTAGEVRAFREGVKKWQAVPASQIIFKHRALILIEQGELAQAAETLRSEKKTSPRSPFPGGRAIAIARLATAASDLGLGDVGRAEIRKAASRAPNNPAIQRQLGHLVSRDDLGRDTAEGFERDAAIAAYKKAAELDREDIYSRLRIGVLLEHDEKGHRYGAVDLNRACTHYDTLDAKQVREFDDGSFVDNIYWCLLHARRYEELSSRIAAMPTATVPILPAVMGAAAHKGPEAAIAEADRLGLSEDNRTGALDSAAQLLFQQRRYEEAVTLLSRIRPEGSGVVEIGSRLRKWKKTKKLEADKILANSPENVLLKLLVSHITDPEKAPEVVKKLIVARAWNQKGESHVAKVLEAWDISEMVTPKTSREVLADAAAANFEATKTGIDRLGYRLQVTVDGGSGPIRFQAFVVKEGKAYRLRAFSDHIAELGAEALYAIRRGEKKRARQWLSWAREKWSAGRREDPLRDGAFIPIWQEGKGNVQLAAAALAARTIHAADAIPVLEKALKSNEHTDYLEQLRLALAIGYGQVKRWEDQLKLSRELLDTHPQSNIARGLVLKPLSELKRFKEQRSVIRNAMTLGPKMLDAWKPILADSYSNAGKFKEARTIQEEIIREGKPTSSIYNTHAWLGMFVGPRESDIEHAVRAVKMAPVGKTAALHTLGCIYADLGQLGKARETLLALLQYRKGNRPLHEDYYIIGRIAEGMGFKKAARKAYLRVKKTEKEFPASTYNLARRQLKLL